MRAAAIITSIALVLCGCQSHRFLIDEVLRAPSHPHVTLVSVVATKDSPAQGYTVSPFPTLVYPFDYAKIGIDGEVVVRLRVGKDGFVKEASIVKSSDQKFEAPVLSATQHWTFKEAAEIPANEPRGMILDCTISFSCQEENSFRFEVRQK